MNIAKLLFRSKKDKICLQIASEVLNKIDYEALEKLYLSNYVAFSFNYLNIGKQFVKDNYFPQVYMLRNGVLDKITRINSELKKGFLRKAFREFSLVAENIIPTYLAPKVEGLDIIKKAILLQCISKKNINILIIGDRVSTIKNNFTESLKTIYPVCSVGQATDFLGIKFEKKEPKFGLIPKANDGVLALTNIELLDDKSIELINMALEKKVIFAKSGKNIASHDTNIKILGIANTKEERFVSNNPDIVNSQINVSEQILDKFHIKFFCRDIYEKETLEKDNSTNNVIIDDFRNESEMNHKLALHAQSKKEEEFNFIQDYLIYAEGFETNFSSRLKDSVVGFVERLQNAYNDRKFLIKPDEKTLVKILIRLSESNARLNLRNEVKKEDIIEAEKIIAGSFLMN